MTRAPVLFRVDAAPRVGWEHLSRCLVLAAALQRRRRPAFFLSQLEPGSLGLTVKRGGNEWIDADAPAGTPEDLEEMVREVRRIRPAAVVVDSPDVKEEYLAELRRMGVLVVSIDSTAGHALSRRGSSSTRCWRRAASPTNSVAARRCCSAPATPSSGRRFAGSGRSGRRSRSSRSAPWWRWATTTRTTRPASWRSSC